MRWRFQVALLLAALSLGCPVHRLAGDFIEDTLYAATRVGSVPDYEFEAIAAAPGLKALEAFHSDEPHHLGTLNALSAGYSQYAFAFLELPAERIEEKDPDRARELRQRAHRMFLRARDFGLEGLDIIHPGFRDLVRGDPSIELDRVMPTDIALLYWTACAWSSAYPDDETGKDEEVVESMMQQAALLDEDFGDGAIHAYFALHDASGPDGKPRDLTKARFHLAKALELSHGEDLSLLVSWASLACSYRHDTAEFSSYLRRVLTFDLNSAPENRFSNEVAVMRAKSLISKISSCSGLQPHRTRIDRVGFHFVPAPKDTVQSPAPPGP